MERVAQEVEAGAGQRPTFRTPPDGQTCATHVAELLEGGLTADEAVQVALLNNPRLQAAFQEIGVARADVVQSQLWRNPTLALGFRFPDGGGLANFEAGLAQSISEIWLLPPRRRAAQRELDRAVLEVARQAGAIALDTRAAYFAVLHAERDAELARQNVALTQELLELTQARQQAGAGGALDVNLSRGQHVEAELAVRQADLEVGRRRAELARLLGLTLPPGTVVLAETLRAPEGLTVTFEAALAAARESRLDLRAAAHVVAAAADHLVAEQRSLFRSVDVGVALEREERRSRGDRDLLADAFWASADAGAPTLPSLRPREREASGVTLGPTVVLELPIFDQNQAQIARARSQYEQALWLQQALEVEVAQDVHAAVQRLLTTAERVRMYREDLLTVQDENLELARAAYQAGAATFLALLEARRSALTASAGYSAALYEAAVARVDLERAIGRPITSLAAPLASPPAP
ncbi:MAG TPA: TolC family protein [Phycisphaerae bacterium]|nr:TolC family protein [Phycisphaerae bacterium]HNU45392.1 TolC family protein [Phycisphaerae bacterium]